MTDPVETGGVEKTAPGRLRAEAVLGELTGLSGSAVKERASGKSDDDENAGAEGEVVSKKSKS